MTLNQPFTGYTPEHIIPYLNRIGFWDFEKFPQPQHDMPKDTIPEPNYTTLHRISYCQGHSIPFGNLSYIYYKELEHPETNYPPNPKKPLSTQGVSIDLIDIFNKLVLKKREGYCFENNLLINFMLRAIGFESHQVSSRIVDTIDWDRDKSLVLQPITHMVTLVYLGENQDDVYLIDVGVHIGQTLTPLKFVENQVQKTSKFMEHRIIRAPMPGDVVESSLKKNWPYVFQVKYERIAGLRHHNRNDWTPVHYFHPSPIYLKDMRILNNHIVQDNRCVFYQHVLLATNTNTGYATFSDTKLKVYSEEGVLSKDLLTEEDRRQVYKEYFGIELDPDYPEHFPSKLLPKM